MMRRLTKLGVVSISVAIGWSCTGGELPGAGGPRRGGAGGSGAQGGAGGSAGSPGAEDGPGGGGLDGNGGGAGEKCDEVGAIRECSPAPCQRGRQVCEKGPTAGSVWSPCRDLTSVPGCTSPDGPCDCGSPTPACEDYCKGRDAGADGPSGCICVPGAIRWCDTPVSCLWGKQTCLPDGTWGACTETPDRPPGCTSPVYSLCCCLMADQCCEGAPYGGKAPSKGKCGGITCGAPPPSACPGKGLCYPGKEAFCVAGTGKAATWGKTTCKPDGTWGDCVSGTPPPADCGTFSVLACCIRAKDYGFCCQLSGCSVAGKCDGIACK